jgi:hypothetical protein
LQHCVSQVIRSREETNVILDGKFVFKVQQSNKWGPITNAAIYRSNVAGFERDTKKSDSLS